MTEDALSKTLLEQYLAAHHQTCPLCGYELHQLRGAACPECGRALRLHVGLEHPNLTAFLTGGVGLSASTGFVVITTVWGAVMGMAGDEFWFMVVLLIATGAVMGTWFALGRRIRRLSRGFQWALAIAGLLSPVVVFTVFYFGIVRR